MRIGIIGSRTFNDYELVKETMNDYVGKTDMVVSGGAKGADLLGERWAKDNGVQTLIFKPEWDKYGKRAGFIRNQDIVKNSDMVIAFWDNKSPGTQNSISIAEKMGKPVKIVIF